MMRFTGKQYLQIDIASNFGLDKEDWDVRLAWFQDNEHHLFDLLDQAKEPALYYAGLLAWRDVNQGKPSGYPISLDATASGLQLLACLTGDRKAAELCNVVNTGHREDAYTNLYQAMLVDAQAQKLVTREMAKEACMTAFYGSQAIPKQVFGTGHLLNVFFNTMEGHAPAAWELNQTYLVIWDSNRDTYRWTMPDNFHVVIKVMTTEVETVHFLDTPYEVVKKVHAPMEGGRSLCANTTHSVDGLVVREMTRRCNYKPETIIKVLEALDSCDYSAEIQVDDDSELVELLWQHYQDSGYLSARILDHLNRNNITLVDHGVLMELINSLPAKPFEIISIHDAFRCLPNYGNDLRQQYQLQLHLIARSNLLSYLLSQVLEQKVQIGKLDPTLAQDILHSEYMLS